MSNIKKCRPNVILEYIEYDGNNLHKVLSFVGEDNYVHNNDNTIAIKVYHTNDSYYTKRLKPGLFIVKTIKNTFMVLSPRDFNASYEII